VYEGEFVNNRPHGQGKYTQADGSIIEGNFQEGKRHGSSIVSLPDGRRYRQEWDMDNLVKTEKLGKASNDKK
jgi:hypothetical protein